MPGMAEGLVGARVSKGLRLGSGSAKGCNVRRHAHRARHTDRELLKLAAYLRKIAPLPSLAKLKHRRWEAYAAAELARLPPPHQGDP